VKANKVLLCPNAPQRKLFEIQTASIEPIPLEKTPDRKSLREKIGLTIDEERELIDMVKWVVKELKES
jgi:hypothetical protein